jgi:hypothetical protein
MLRARAHGRASATAPLSSDSTRKPRSLLPSGRSHACTHHSPSKHSPTGRESGCCSHGKARTVPARSSRLRDARRAPILAPPTPEAAESGL